MISFGTDITPAVTMDVCLNAEVPQVTEVQWRANISNAEVNGLHADAFGTRTASEDERDWRPLVDDTACAA